MGVDATWMNLANVVGGTRRWGGEEGGGQSESKWKQMEKSRKETLKLEVKFGCYEKFAGWFSTSFSFYLLTTIHFLPQNMSAAILLPLSCFHSSPFTITHDSTARFLYFSIVFWVLPQMRCYMVTWKHCGQLTGQRESPLAPQKSHSYAQIDVVCINNEYSSMFIDHKYGFTKI